MYFLGKNYVNTKIETIFWARCIVRNSWFEFKKVYKQFSIYRGMHKRPCEKFKYGRQGGRGNNHFRSLIQTIFLKLKKNKV